MADARGNLALEFLRLAQRTRARWLVWENVPGVLSSNGGRDFGAILGGMVELGYGIAYRVLDAQYVRVDGFGRAVPQRRRRVFVVGYLGDWRCAAAVLFERASLLGDSAPGRETGERVVPTISARTEGGGGLGTDFDCDGGLIPSHDVSQPLLGKENSSHRADAESYIANAPIISPALKSRDFKGPSSDGDGDGAPLIAIQERAVCENPDAGPDGVGVRDDGASFTLEARTVPQAVATAWAVRRLTPLECERLQGFPDGYTDVPWRNKNWTPDGPRYKALGNSMAVNCMRWIGRRIEMVEMLSIRREL